MCEDKVKKDGFQKASDFSLYIGGMRKILCNGRLRA
jgi:hypothetical protein